MVKITSSSRFTFIRLLFTIIFGLLTTARGIRPIIGDIILLTTIIIIVFMHICITSTSTNTTDIIIAAIGMHMRPAPLIARYALPFRVAITQKPIPRSRFRHDRQTLRYKTNAVCKWPTEARHKVYARHALRLPAAEPAIPRLKQPQAEVQATARQGFRHNAQPKRVPKQLAQRSEARLPPLALRSAQAAAEILCLEQAFRVPQPQQREVHPVSEHLLPQEAIARATARQAVAAAVLRRRAGVLLQVPRRGALRAVRAAAIHGDRFSPIQKKEAAGSVASFFVADTRQGRFLFYNRQMRTMIHSD